MSLVTKQSDEPANLWPGMSAQGIAEHLKFREAPIPADAGPTGNLATMAVLPYWAAWVCLGAWGFRFNDYDIFHAWWMILAVFLITAPAVYPACLLTGRLRVSAVALSTVAAGMLIYGTYEWLAEMLGGWSFGEAGSWMRVASLPLSALGCSALTAIVLVPTLGRTLGPFAVPLLLIAAVPTGLLDSGGWLLSADHWHHHLLENLILFFEAVILPLVVAATAQRLATLKNPRRGAVSALVRFWRGSVPTQVALLFIYPLTLGTVLYLHSLEKGLAQGHHSFWEYENLRAGTWVLLLAILAVGSVITWRVLNEAARQGTRGARWGQGLVVLIAVPIVLFVFHSEGFWIGRVMTDSTKAWSGSAYGFRLLDQGTELEVSGDVIYGLARQLSDQLAAHPSVWRLRLDSSGGLTEEATAAAQVIAAHDLTTVVSGECSSACTAMFLAGKDRTIEGQGRLGFHAARRADTIRTSNNTIRELYAPYRLDSTFITRVEAVNPPSLWYPTREELVAARVLPSPGTNGFKVR